MKIIELRAENVKRLKAVHITPDGTVQIITGRNGQGKTSVLDAIFLAVGGGDAKKTTVMPIRDGEEKASVLVDLGDLKVTRRWTLSGSTLVVENADGSRPKSPQAVLDELIGRMSFDPLEFTQLRAKDQVDALLAIVDLPFVPEEIDAERAAVYSARTDVNRRVKELRVQLDDAPPVDMATPDELVSASDLVERINEATTANARIGSARTAALNAQRDVADLEARLETARSLAAEAADRLAALGDEQDITALQEQLTQVEATNNDVRLKLRRRQIQETLSEAVAAAERMDEEIAAIDKRKADGLAAAAFPVDGLGFGDGIVTYQGVPFSQASSAEQIRVSLGMAMAANPTLRVIRILDGSLLDDDNMRVVAEMAEANDFQVWIERVGTEGTGSTVVIEDGEVQS